jgi:hypothetical protein
MSTSNGISTTRVVWIIVFTGLLWLILYAPAKTSPQRFSEILAQEHSTYAAALGSDTADRMLGRLDQLQLMPRVYEFAITPPPSHSANPTERVAERMSAVTHRFLSHPYFQSLDGLVALAAFRAIGLFELLAVVLVFLGVAFVDAIAVRRVVAAELGGVKTERYRLGEIGAVLSLAGLLVACFLPLPVPPAAPLLMMLTLVFALSRMLSAYHRML